MEIEDDLISLSLPDSEEESIIKVIGVGGGGSNAVNHMARLGIHGVEFVVCNTDIQALRQSKVKNRIQLGRELTEGRGAGCLPERGRMAALESMDAVKAILSRNTRMIFITAGMGGGTGTGAAPEIAKIAREMGILTIGIVTLPFGFEGKRKVEQAWEGVGELKQYVDALLIIANEKLREIYGDLKISEAFAKADDVLAIAAKSIAEIITVRGYVNVDFADVESVMRNSGVALMGAAEAEGGERDRIALENALVSPLLNSNDIRGASNILLNILYGEKEVTIEEIGYITNSLREKVGRNVNVIWGAGKDDTLGEKLRIAVIASGFHNNLDNICVSEDEEKGRKEKEPADAPKGKPFFHVQEQPEELQMEMVGPEEEDRQRKPKRKPEVRKPEPSAPRKPKQEAGSGKSWLKRQVGDLGDLFSEAGE